MLDNVTKGEAFLSTPSARRATARQRAGGILLVISIHALREEGDGDAAVGVAAHRGISIHALREEGDTIISYTSDSIKISIHALREEGDCTRGRNRSHHCISIHALREEGDDR